MAAEPPYVRAARRANWLRTARANLKLDLKAGRDWHAVLSGNDEKWEDVVKVTKLSVVMLAIPGVGPVTVREAMATLGLNDEPRVGELTYERRQQLADLVRAGLEGEAAEEVSA